MAESHIRKRVKKKEDDDDGGGYNFKTTILLNEKLDPASSRHGFCANNSVLSIGVVDLNGEWVGHDDDDDDELKSTHCVLLLRR